MLIILITFVIKIRTKCKILFAIIQPNTAIFRRIGGRQAYTTLCAMNVIRCMYKNRIKGRSSFLTGAETVLHQTATGSLEWSCGQTC